MKMPWYPTRPHIVREVVVVTTTHRNGAKRDELYLNTIDRSRYTPEKLREIRRDGKHR